MRAGNVNVAARTTSPVLIEMSDMSPQLRVPAIACGGAPGGTASSQAYGESDWSGVISGTLGPAEGTPLGVGVATLMGRSESMSACVDGCNGLAPCGEESSIGGFSKEA